MSFFWQTIPRFHPQVGAGPVLSALVGPSAQELPFALPGGGELREGRDFFALSGASAAVTLALRSLDLPAGSGVAVPIYTCLAVFEAVRRAGHRCVFIDVDPDTLGYDLDDLSRRRDELAAAVVVHTFGFPADMRAIAGILPGRPIVEDCSHALGSSIGGKAAGLFGCAAAFSFNLAKPLSVGGGGFLLVNDARLGPAVAAQVEALAPARARPPIRAVLRRAGKAALFRPPAYGTLTRLGLIDPDRQAGWPDAPQARMTGLDRAMVRRGMERLAGRFAEQRRWAAEMSARAGEPAPAGRYVARGEDWNGYHWPVLLPTPEQRDRSLAFFRRRGVDAFLLWGECLWAAGQCGYAPGACPRGEDALRRLLLLPCYAELTASQRGRILAAIDEWRREVR